MWTSFWIRIRININSISRFGTGLWNGIYSKGRISRWTSTIIKEPKLKFWTDLKKGLWGDETLEIWPQAIQFDPLFLHVDVVVDNVSFQIKEFKSLFNLRIGFKKKIKNNRSVATFLYSRNLTVFIFWRMFQRLAGKDLTPVCTKWLK